ncbi:hypothetical protein Tco_0316654 [Tanacetum coccineum]
MKAFPLETLVSIALKMDRYPMVADFCKPTLGNLLSRRWLFLARSFRTFSKLATVDPMRDTMVPITQQERSLIQVFIGPPSTKMPKDLSPNVTNVNVKEKLRIRYRDATKLHPSLAKSRHLGH